LAIIVPALCLSVLLVNHKQDHYPISPDFAQEYYLLGNSYQKIDRLAEAIIYWDLALKENPSYTLAKHNITLAQSTLKSDSLAKQIKIDSMNVHLCLEYCDVLLSLRNDSAALSVIDKFLEKNPYVPLAWGKKGLIYAAHFCNYDSAKVAYQRALDLDAQHGGYWVNLGNCYLKLNEKEKAIECWKRYLELNPEDTMIKRNILQLEGKI
jgi:tetratricopeptide (TPR) repeat protein